MTRDDSQEPRRRHTTAGAGCHILTTCLVLTAGIAANGQAANQHQQLLHLLEREVRTNAGWVRIHAADALLDHGETQAPAKALGGETETAAPPYRIGVWRVMARAAATAEERRSFSERIRRDLLDPQAPDRLHAAESLAKLGLANPADRLIIQEWLAVTDDATAVFPLWLLVLSSSQAERRGNEARLASLLSSTNSLVRQRASFALGRIKTLCAATLDRLNQHLESEPADSPARPYFLAAVLEHTPRDLARAAELRQQLAACLATGKPSEQLEAATVLGRCGTTQEAHILCKSLNSREADARIGAANGLLYLLP